MITNVSLRRATSSEYRFTKVRKKKLYIWIYNLHTGIIRRLTNRKLGDLTGSDRHTEEESIRIEKEV